MSWCLWAWQKHFPCIVQKTSCSPEWVTKKDAEWNTFSWLFINKSVYIYIYIDILPPQKKYTYKKHPKPFCLGATDYTNSTQYQTFNKKRQNKNPTAKNYTIHYSQYTKHCWIGPKGSGQSHLCCGSNCESNREKVTRLFTYYSRRCQGSVGYSWTGEVFWLLRCRPSPTLPQLLTAPALSCWLVGCI